MTQPFAETTFTTDTATLAVFDPASIAHRASDDADWWSVPTFEIQEINAGKVLFAALGADGTYNCKIFRGAVGKAKLEGLIDVQSGCIYIGAGEEVPGAGYGPSTRYGGVLISFQCGCCKVQVTNGDSSELLIYLSSTTHAAQNSFSSSPELV